MTIAAKAAILCLPGGALILGAMWLLRCHHPRTLYARDDDGRAIWRCADCRRLWPNAAYVGPAPARLPRAVPMEEAMPALLADLEDSNGK